MRRGSNGSGRVRCGAGQGSNVRGLAGKTGHGWWWQCRVRLVAAVQVISAQKVLF